jgi:hypothetical protein
MELVSKNILELEIIMGTGKTDRDTGKELWYMLTKTFIRASGQMVKKKDKAHTFSKVQAWSTLAHSKMGNLSMANGFIQMAVISKATLIIINQKERVNGIFKMETKLKAIINK